MKKQSKKNKEKKEKGENKELKEIIKKIVPVLKKHGVKKAGIFGSFARGDSTKKSDIDVLIEFNGSLLDLVGLEMELEKILGRKVDIVTYKGISPYLKKPILKDELKVI